MNKVNDHDLFFEAIDKYLIDEFVYRLDRYQLSNKMFPVTDHIYKSMLSIPLYTAMTDQDQDLVIEALYSALK